jgi:hypothetical protein
LLWFFLSMTHVHMPSMEWNVDWSLLFYVPALKAILMARAVCPASASVVS